METLKGILATILLVVVIGVCFGLIYFLTIFGGIVLLGLFIYVMIREYNREMAEMDDDQEGD